MNLLSLSLRLIAGSLFITKHLIMWLFIIQRWINYSENGLENGSYCTPKMNAKGSTQGCDKKKKSYFHKFHMIAFANIFIYFQPKRQIGSLEMINTFFDCFKMLVVISVNYVFFFLTHSLYTHLMLPSVL